MVRQRAWEKFSSTPWACPIHIQHFSPFLISIVRILYTMFCSYLSPWILGDPPSLPTKLCVFLFFLHSDQVHFLLPIHSCMYGLSLVHGMLTRSDNHIENCLFLSQKLFIVNNSLSMWITSNPFLLSKMEIEFAQVLCML